MKRTSAAVPTVFAVLALATAASAASAPPNAQFATVLWQRYGTVVATDEPLATDARYLRAGCRGETSDTHSMVIVGIVVAWQRITQQGFCWSHNRIYWTGGTTVRRWTSWLYCWKDQSDGDSWTSYPKWRQGWSSATLGGNAVFGCVSLQYDHPRIDYANGGGVWRH